MRIIGILLLLLLILPIVEASAETSWTHEFEAGYITTKPLIVDDTVYARTSGLWTGNEQPVVAAFDVFTGEKLWSFASQTARQNDMTPLLYVNSGQGSCGVWEDLLIVGWVDGKITAHSPKNGSIVWENQTGDNFRGITGQMALETDRVVVPTRTGLSTFCLANGIELLRVETESIGWRNGVTVTEAGYVFGDEAGNLHTVTRNGNLSSTMLGEGKIRHAPLETRHGLFVHLQTDEGSSMYLNGSILGKMGHSPAMPLMHENRIYAATSDEWISILCGENTCAIESTEPFHSNGELSLRVVESGLEVWAPSNTPEGGWGVFNQTALMRMEHTSFDTYGTAAPGFSSGIVAIGNDAGTLQVTNLGFVSENTTQSESGTFEVFLRATILLMFVFTIVFLARKDWSTASKFGSAFLLVVAIVVVPELSVKVAEQTSPRYDVEWDESWPDEWQETQVVVFEIDGITYAIGGLEPQKNVYDLTVIACQELDIEPQIEQQYLGPYLVSFNGFAGDGWEFMLDGQRSPVGMADAKLGDASIVEWRPA